MSAHCNCPEHKKDPYVREEEIYCGVPDNEAPAVSKEKMCANCGGLIRVIA